MHYGSDGLIQPNYTGPVQHPFNASAAWDRWDGEPTPTGADRPTTECCLGVGGSWGCPIHGHDNRPQLAAIEAEARQQPQPLDVDVLAEAMWNVISTRAHAEHEPGECPTCDTHRALVNEVVADDSRAVAAEYLRLSSTPARPSPTEDGA